MRRILKVATQIQFLTQIRDVDNFEFLEKDTNFLNPTLVENESEDYIRPEKNPEWEHTQSQQHCNDSAFDEAVGYFPPNAWCKTQKRHNRREPGVFEEGLRCRDDRFM